MKKILLFSLIVLHGGIIYAQTNWAVDKNHTNIGFSVTHMVISEVIGEFKDFEASVTDAPDDFIGAKVMFVAKTASISTDNENRDKDLRSERFFDAEAYPEIKFSGKIVKEGDNLFLDGDFTMKDVTKNIKFDVKYNGTIPGRRGRKAGFKVTGVINRFDYGIKYDSVIETGGLVASEDITITCNVELNEQKEG